MMMRLAAGLLVLGGVCAGAALAGDFDTLRVAETTTFDNLQAGPASTALLLSPDGGRMLHLSIKDMCLYDMAGGTPKQLSCAGRGARAMVTDDMFWAPDGNHLVMPLFGGAMLRFVDTDIEVLDPQTWESVNLTNDLFEGSSFKKGPGMLDFPAAWLDAETLVYARVPFGKTGFQDRKGAALMTTKTSGAPGMLAADISLPSGLVVALDVAADGTVGYVVDDRKTPGAAGVYVLKPGSDRPFLVAPASVFSRPPAGLSFSADGAYIVVFEPPKEGSIPIPTVIEVASGAVTRIAQGAEVAGVAWSPVGAALAYVTLADKRGDDGALYLAEPPTAPGRLLAKGPFMPPVCCGQQPIIWAANDTMVLGNTQKPNAPFLLRFQR